MTVSSCLVARCRHETERTLVPGYSFRKCVPTGVGSNLAFDASPLGAWLIRRSTPLCLFAFSTRKFQSIFAVRRRERLFADLAMDQSMREVSIGLHAHDLIA